MELKNLSKYRSQIYGFSILWIMLFHAIDILDLHYDHFSHYLTPLDAVLGYGNIGVDIFLFLSGVCLYFSFQKSQDIGAYMRKRAMRLYLPAILIDGWYWLVFFWLLGGSFFRFFRKITLLSFWMNGDQMIWFVSLILLLYVLYPYFYSIIFGGKKEYAWLRTLLLMAAVVLLNMAFQEATDLVYGRYEIALTRIPVFVAGAFFGKYVFEGKKLPGLIYIAAALVIACGIWLQYGGMIRGTSGRYWASFMGVSVMILLELVLRTVRFAWLHKFLAFFGEMSLELYLSHILMIHLYRRTPFGEEKRLLEYLVILILAVAVAWIAKKICDRISVRLQPGKAQPQ